MNARRSVDETTYHACHDDYWCDTNQGVEVSR